MPMTDDEKMLAFGRMVFGMMTDVLVSPPDGTAYACRGVTCPDGRGRKHYLDLLVCRPAVTKVMTEVVGEHFAVTDINEPTGGQTQ